MVDSLDGRFLSEGMYWLIDFGLASNSLILLHNIATDHILEALEH